MCLELKCRVRPLLWVARRSPQHGEEYLSDTGHRIEYIDVAGGRRREDYGRNVTVLRQLTSVEALTGIFDGADFYIVTERRQAHRSRHGHARGIRLHRLG